MHRSAPRQLTILGPGKAPRRFVYLALMLTVVGLVGTPLLDAEQLPKEDLEFLRGLAVDAISASTVAPGSNGGGRWPLTNACGFALVTPGKDTYTAFWIRDFSMAADSGLLSPSTLLEHLLLICQVQNGPADRKLTHGLHLPPWSVPDHINYDGR